jgi:Ca2+-binding EF-hand superfamily protein
MTTFGMKRSLLVAAALVVVSAAAQDSDQKPVAPPEKKLAQGEKEAKKMLLLMDKDNSGKVSKQEFMNFMEAEFQRLDINHDGELDVKELTDSRVQIRTRGR